MVLELYHPGLEGVIAGETEITCVDGDFLYRGYQLSDLLDGAGFLEVVHLLLLEELPTEEQLADFRSLLWEDATLPEPVAQFVRELPLHISPVDMLRTGVSLLGNFDPQLDDPIRIAGVSQASRLLAHVPLMLALWTRQRDGRVIATPTPLLSYAGNVLLLLTGREPDSLAEQALNASLIASADEAFTTSAFTGRMVASAGGDLLSSVTAAISCCAGAQFGQRFSAVSNVLSSVGTCEDAERWVRYRVGESLPLPGFGPAREQDADVRALLLERCCCELAVATGLEETEDLAAAIEQAVWSATGRSPTIDWPLVRLYRALGIDADLHASLFLCGRLAGWCAHIVEQAENEQTIQPRSRYRGVVRADFEPLRDRG